MVVSSTWKNVERKVALILGGRRVPLSGSNNGFAVGDVDHPVFFVEVKHRGRIPFMKDFKKAISETPGGKVCLLVFHEKQSDKYVAMLDLEDLVSLCNIKP